MFWCFLISFLGVLWLWILDFLARGLCVGCLYCCFAVCVACDLLDVSVWVVVSADFGLWVGGFFLDLVNWGDAGCLDFAAVWLGCWMVVSRLLRVLDGFVEFVGCGGI